MNDVSVNIFNRTYNIKCDLHEVSDLQESADYLDKQMKLMKDNSQLSSTDRIAVITALNMANELMLLKKQQHHSMKNMAEQIDHLKNKIENFLAVEEEAIA